MSRIQALIFDMDGTMIVSRLPSPQRAGVTQ